MAFPVWRPSTSLRESGYFPWWHPYFRFGLREWVAPDPGQAQQTLARIRQLTAQRRTVYLPTHDPEATTRLERGQVTPQS